jgi:hypothetical protein
MTGATERCRRCRLTVRPRRYLTTGSIAMLVCPACNAFLRYALAGDRYPVS